MHKRFASLLILLAAASSLAAGAQKTINFTSTSSTGECFTATWVQVADNSPNWRITNASVTASGLTFGANGDQFTMKNTSGSPGDIWDLSQGAWLAPGSRSTVVASSSGVVWTLSYGGSCSTSSPPPASGTVSVMWMGDSITAGYDTPAAEAQGGARCAYYWRVLGTTGVTLEMVGSSNTLPPPANSAVTSVIVATTFPGCPSNAQGWSGYGGETTDGIVYGGSDGVGDYYGGALPDVAKFLPQIIVYQGGTNNIAHSTYYPGEVTQSITNGLNSIWGEDPGALIVLVEIPNFVTPAWASDQALVASVNAEIAGVYQSFANAGKRILLSTDYTSIPANSTTMPDGCCHPSNLVYINHANAVADLTAPYVKAIASAGDDDAAIAAAISQQMSSADVVQAAFVTPETLASTLP